MVRRGIFKILSCLLVLCSCTSKNEIFTESTLFSVDSYNVSKSLFVSDIIPFSANDLRLSSNSMDDEVYATYKKNNTCFIGKYDIVNNKLVDLISANDIVYLLDEKLIEFIIEEVSMSFIDVYQNKILMSVRANLSWVSEQLIISFDLESKHIELVYLYPKTDYSNSYTPQMIYENHMYLDIMNDEKMQTEIIKIDLNNNIAEVFKENAQLPLMCFNEICYFRLQDQNMLLYNENDELISNLGKNIDRYSILGTDDAVYFHSYFTSDKKEEAINKINGNADISLKELKKIESDEVYSVSLVSKLDLNKEITDLVVRYDNAFLQFPTFDGRFISFSMFKGCEVILYDIMQNRILGISLDKAVYCSSYVISTSNHLLIHSWINKQDQTYEQIHLTDRNELIKQISKIE